MDAAVTDIAYQRPVRRWKPERCDRISLVLQGGGALGAYQAGVFQALSEADIEPDWVTAVSIGAINSAIIAGNSKQWRLKRLRTFWERITERKIWNYTPDGDVFRKARNAACSWMTLIQGQPGFSRRANRPRGSVLPELKAQLAITTMRRSYYDNAPLRETLEDLVDFSLLNEKTMGFSVGAVNVLSGNFVYFDNQHETIEPEHVMASGALPRRCRWSKSAPIISGTEASSPILRCNISSTRTTRSTLSSSRSIFSARAACFRATSRMSWRGTRTSCIPRARATTPTSIDGFIPGKSAFLPRCERSPTTGCRMTSASCETNLQSYLRSRSCS
jgi:hypothetical protein